MKEQITPQAVGQMFEFDFSEQEKRTAMSRDDIKFCETVESGIVHLEDLHYEMPLPLKRQNIQLPNNYAQVERRLTGLKRPMTDTRIMGITPVLCLTSYPKDRLARWMMSSKMKLEEPGTFLIMGSITCKKSKV